jgi:hypothetical protein
MKETRRDFLKKSGMTGAGIFSAGMIGCTTQPKTSGEPFPQTHTQSFNMSGYAAPKIDLVRVAIIGLGNRGPGTARRLSSIEGVEIKALCDLEQDRVESTAELIKPMGHNPDFYFGDENHWKTICERTDIDLIAIVTPWHLHTPMCVFAMEHDKHAYVELPAATTMEECWQLVETSERTRKHCIQMSSDASAVQLNMVREGVYGELIHAEGCYIHDLLLNNNFTKDKYHNMWRLKANIGRHGNLYPQHGLVPIMQYMDICYGDKMDFLTSVSSKDFLMGKTAERLAKEDDFWKTYVDKEYRGNMNVTVIKTVQGRTIVMQHDVSSPRPRGGSLLSGTKAIYQSSPGRFAYGHQGWISEEEFRELRQKYTPAVAKKFNELVNEAKQLDPQGRGYFTTSPTDWRLIDSLRNGLAVDRDVYEAATSSVITPLSVWSTSNRSNSVTVPDFTSGKWETNERAVDIDFKRGGGTTRLL